MAQYTVKTAVGAGVAPVSVTPTASDTIAVADIGSRGVILRVVTTGTATNVTVLDPGKTAASNPGNPAAVACPATGTRYIFIGSNSVDPATGVATVNFSSQTGVSVEAVRY